MRQQLAECTHAPSITSLQAWYAGGTAPPCSAMPAATAAGDSYETLASNAEGAALALRDFLPTGAAAGAAAPAASLPAAAAVAEAAAAAAAWRTQM